MPLSPNILLLRTSVCICGKLIEWEFTVAEYDAILDAF